MQRRWVAIVAVGICLLGLCDAKPLARMLRTNTTSFSKSLSATEEISFSESVSAGSSSFSASTSWTQTTTITPPPTATQTYSFSQSLSETGVSSSLTSTASNSFSMTASEESWSVSKSFSASPSIATWSQTDTYPTGTATKLPPPTPTRRSHSKSLINTKSLSFTEGSSTFTMTTSLSLSLSPSTTLSAVLQPISSAPAPPTTAAPRLLTLYDLPDCSDASICSTQFQQCAASSVDCTNVAYCIQQRIACLNILPASDNRCASLVSIQAALRNVTIGSEEYYPESSSYLNCRAATTSWFEDLKLQQRCLNEQYLSEACRAPMSTALTVSFQGAFGFYSNQGLQARFTAAALTDLNKTFSPAKVFASKAVVIPAKRKQSPMRLLLQITVDGVNSSSLSFRQKYAALVLNSQASFPTTAKEYSEITEGDFFVVTGISVGTTEALIGESFGSSYNYTLSPQSTASSSPQSTVVATSVPSTASPAFNETFNASLSGDQQSQQSRNLAISFGVVGTAALIVLIAMSAVLLRRKCRHHDPKGDSALSPLEEPSPAGLVLEGEAAVLDVSDEAQQIVIDIPSEGIQELGPVKDEHTDLPPADAHSPALQPMPE